jgi:hypothetical protein
MPMPPGGSGPNLHPSGGSAAAMYPGQSSAYEGVPFRPQKSNTGLILAILAVVLVGGGIAAFVAVSGKEDDKGKGSGSGSGSQVAMLEDAGVGGGSSDTPDAAEAPATDAAVPVDAEALADAAGGGSAEAPKDAGALLPEPVGVLIVSKSPPTFEVWENDRKLFNGPDNLPVPVGESRKITIKARGYKDKTFTVAADIKGHKLEFKLDRMTGSGPGPGPGSGSAGPGSGSAKPSDPGCKNVVVDARNDACLKQYCKSHPEDLRCE